MRGRARARAREAADAFGVMGAFVAAGLGLAALGRAVPGGDPYPSPAMAVAADDPCAPAGAVRATAAPGVWLVDGFNVLCAGVLRGRERSAFWSGESRQRLLDRVARFEDRSARIIVVFDGEGPASEPRAGEPESVFASSADEWILASLREHAPQRVAVVTADRQLAGRARHRGAEVVPPLRFLARCEAPCRE